MTEIRKLLIACVCALPLCAAAQWQWLDKDGRKVYSDRPPPSEVPAKNILRSPMGGTLSSFGPETAGQPTPSASAPAAANAAANAAADAADAARSAALAAEDAKRRADSCKRARDSLVVLRSGVRLKAPNAKGDIDVISDAERAGEIERLQAIVATECK